LRPRVPTGRATQLTKQDQPKLDCSDVNKDLTLKSKAKDSGFKAKDSAFKAKAKDRTFEGLNRELDI